MRGIFVMMLIASAVHAGNTTYLGSRGEPIGYSIQQGDQTIYLNRYGAPVAYGLSDQSMQQGIDDTPRRSRRNSVDDVPLLPSIEPLDQLAE